MLQLAFTPDRAGPEPLYRQLAGYLREMVETGHLAQGVKLPATRELAVTLGLSRNTATQAYDELLALGLLVAHVGQGTFVAENTAAVAPVAASAVGTPPQRGFVWSGLFAQRVRSLAFPPGLRAAEPATTPARFDFRGGQVAHDALPADDLRKAFIRLTDYRLPELAGRPDPFGWRPLREAVARYLMSRGIACDPGDVAIVNGGQQALDLTARVLLDPGDTVVVEQPGYFGAACVFGACRANLVGIGVDAEGMRTDELARVLRSRRVKLIYATPAAQCPTGVAMSDARRRELLALADEHQAPVFEDDYDSELRYSGPPIPALKTIDATGQVIYAGTFSKVLFPGLRVGYVVAAQPLLEKMILARWNVDVSTSVLMQAVLADLLDSGAFERHLRRMRKLYTTRHAAMLAALEEHMPPGVRWTKPDGGLSVWLTLPSAVDSDALFEAARAAGVAYLGGEVFYFDGRGAGGLMLSFADHPPEEIAEGVALLSALIQRHTVTTQTHTRKQW